MQKLPAKTIVACAAISILTGSSAFAQTLTTESFSASSPLQLLSSSGDFTLPDFDSSLGTLEGITLTLTVTNGATIDIYNTSSAAQNFVNAMLAESGSVSGPGGTMLSTSLDVTLPSGTANPGKNSFSTAQYTNTATNQIDSSNFSLWEDQSGKTVDFTYEKGNVTYGGTDVAGDNLLFGGKADGTGEVTVEYSYLSGDPVSTPEPGSFALGGIAAAALALIIVRRRPATI